MFLRPSDFFHFLHYEHQAIFAKCTFVWEALNYLEAYISTYHQKPIEPKNYPGVMMIHPEQIFIGEGTVIEQGAYIQGPCIIGKRCRIRHGAYIRENVICGDECVIGHGTEIKNVIALNQVHIAHLAYGGDSIYGNGCNLGAGVKCANLKFDGSLVTIHHEGQHYGTNKRKLGVVVGDQSQLGCNSVTNPGTLLGPGCHLFPCTNYGGVAPPQSQIRMNAKAIVELRKVHG